MIGFLLFAGCGDDGGQRDAAIAEGGPDAIDDGAVQTGIDAAVSPSCVVIDGGVRIEHAPADGGILGRNLPISMGDASVGEFDPSLAVSTIGTALVSYTAQRSDGHTFIGTARAGALGLLSGATGPRGGFGGTGATYQRYPVVAFSERSTTDRRFYLAYLSHDLDAATNLPVGESVQVLTSTDDGVTWQGPVRADDPADSGTLPASGPDKPWLVVSPTDGAVWIVYRSGSDTLLRVVRAPPALPLAFARPSLLVFDPNDPRITGASSTDPLHDLATGGNGRARIAVTDAGDVLVSWIHVLGSLDGSDHNTVRLARLPATQSAFNLPSVASGGSERVVFDDPPVVPSPAGSTVYVAYVVNLASALPVVRAWEVRVAKSSDDFRTAGTRVSASDWGAYVNGCAVTRMHPSLALDRVSTNDRLHLVFYDDRYGTIAPGLGAFLYTTATSISFGGMNSFVNDADFPMVDLGDYTDLAVAGGRLWTAWTDARYGQPHIEFATGPTP